MAKMVEKKLIVEPKRTNKGSWPRKKVSGYEAFFSKNATKAGIGKMIVCGSYRRGCGVCGDMDIVVIPEEGGIEKLLTFLEENKFNILISGSKRVRAVSEDGFQIDFVFTTEESFGAAALYLTGSAQFNMNIRNNAKKMGMLLNEYGLFNKDERIASDEKGILERLGLSIYFNPSARSIGGHSR